jgi:hypothetical protein
MDGVNKFEIRILEDIKRITPEIWMMKNLIPIPMTSFACLR